MHRAFPNLARPPHAPTGAPRSPSPPPPPAAADAAAPPAARNRAPLTTRAPARRRRARAAWPALAVGIVVGVAMRWFFTAARRSRRSQRGAF
jgi:hypothetical protein